MIAIAVAREHRETRLADGGTERGLPWPFSRFLTHPLPKSLFFLFFTRFGPVFNKIRCSLYLLPSLRCDHSFITVNLSLSLSLSRRLPQAATCYQVLILQVFVSEFCCVVHGAKSLWRFVEVSIRTLIRNELSALFAHAI